MSKIKYFLALGLFIFGCGGAYEDTEFYEAPDAGLGQAKQAPDSGLGQAKQALNADDAYVPYWFGTAINPSSVNTQLFGTAVPCMQAYQYSGKCAIPWKEKYEIRVCFPTGYYPALQWNDNLYHPATLVKAKLESLGKNVIISPSNQSNCSTARNNSRTVINVKYGTVSGSALANSTPHLSGNDFGSDVLQTYDREQILIDDAKIWQGSTNVQSWPTAEGIIFTKNIVLHEIWHAVGLPHDYYYNSTLTYTGCMTPTGNPNPGSAFRTQLCQLKSWEENAISNFWLY